MSETEWARSPDPDVLLSHALGKTTERKLRLCACACSRRVWPSPTPPPRFADPWDTERAQGDQWPADSIARDQGTQPEGEFCWPRGDAAPIRRAVETAERFADGQASEGDLRSCFDACLALADRAQSIAGSANY